MLAKSMSNNIIDLNEYRSQSQAGGARVSLVDAITAFQQAMAAAGLGMPRIDADGQLHRFDVPGDAKRDKAGWYVFYSDNIPSGSFGSWRLNTFESWSYAANWEISAAEMREIKERQAQAKAAREELRAKLAHEAAGVAGSLWNGAKAEPEAKDHPYLTQKGVRALGIRLGEDSGTLLVPMHNIAGELLNVQKIFSNGEKRFLRDAHVTGCFHWIDGDRGTVYVCEGYATGASLAMATGCAVAVAFNAGNLEPVARALRGVMPDAALVLAADNDRWTKKQDGTPWNTGIEAAQKAAKATGAAVVWPEFKDLTGNPTDFNDLMLAEGLDEVRLQAGVSGAGPRLADWSIERFEGAAKPVAWLVDDLLPLAYPCLLAAGGGTGKGMLSLDLALKVAAGESGLDLLNGEKWLGHRVIADGTAVIITAEDSRESIHQRLEGLDPDGSRRSRARGRLYIVPLPDAGGPMQLIGNSGTGFSPTPAFEAVRRQIRRMKDVRLINIDPLAAFVGVDINADPQAGQYVNGLLANLAAETGACVLVAHHMTKPPSVGGKTAWTADSARNAIRGTTALVDGVRLALAIWPAGDTVSKEACAALGKQPKRGLVYEAAVVKANVPASEDVKVLVRGNNGLLEARDTEIRAVRGDRKEVLNLLVEAVQQAARDGRPFTKRGQTGVFMRREELPRAVRNFGGRDRLEGLVQDLLESGALVGCTYKTSVGKFLDVPDGPFAEGVGIIEAGWSKTDEL